jgi:hypothetical protein
MLNDPVETKDEAFHDNHVDMVEKATIHELSGHMEYLKLRLKNAHKSAMNDAKLMIKLREDLDQLAHEKRTWHLVSGMSIKETQLVEYIAVLEQAGIESDREKFRTSIEMRDIQEQLRDFKSVNETLDKIKEILEVLSDQHGRAKKERVEAMNENGPPPP